ncbi:hypothetical protein KIPB_011634, partial [Kipferlia bialata]|eukprot:g11634.t1
MPIVVALLNETVTLASDILPDHVAEHILSSEIDDEATAREGLVEVVVPGDGPV